MNFAINRITLNPTLEKLILASICSGLLDSSVVKADELSKLGRVVFHAAENLLREGAEPPLDEGSVLLVAVEVFGATPEEIKSFLKSIRVAANAAKNPKEILTLVRHKQALVDVINEAGKQLLQADFSPSQLMSLLENGTLAKCLSMSEELDGKIPDMPEGVPIKSLPILSDRSGGIYGLWALAGAPGVGKSTFALQIALDIGRHIPVLLYDFENGKVVLANRAYTVFNDRVFELTKNIYVRESIRTLESDLAAIRAPALIVVDSVQKLPASVEFRRTGLDRWIHRLESLKKRGYHLLLISEVGRALYNSGPYIGSFKETGEIEYSADLGMQLIENEDTNEVEIHIVKNRHHPHRGLVSVVSRVKDWWFREENPEEEEEITKWTVPHSSEQ